MLINQVHKFIPFLIMCLCVGKLGYSLEMDEDGGRIERGLLEMYEEDDLSDCSLFTDHFINFGFWNGIDQTGKITLEQRLESSQNLYRLVASELSITANDHVIEVGCGQGVGTALIFDEFHPQKILGIDFSKAQIHRAAQINASSVGKQLIFQQGSAEKIPLPSSSFDKMYTVEAAQHFEDFESFASESYRVLKPGGKLAVAAFFGTSDQSFSCVAPMIQTVRDGIDKMTPVDEVKRMLIESGYTHVKIESIGKNVWPSFDQWVGQTELKDSWTRNWFKAYQQNLLDYYLIIAEKS